MANVIGSIIGSIINAVVLLMLLSVDHTLALWWLVGSVVMGPVWAAVIVAANNKAALALLEKLEEK